MIPNYKQIIRAERERYKMYGLDIKFPNRQKQKPEIIYKDVIKEVIVEKKVEVEKIVEKKVEVFVDKPVFVDRVIVEEKPVYVPAERKPMN